MEEIVRELKLCQKKLDITTGDWGGGGTGERACETRELHDQLVSKGEENLESYQSEGTRWQNRRYN